MKILIALVGIVFLFTLIGCEKPVREAHSNNDDQMALAK